MKSPRGASITAVAAFVSVASFAPAISAQAWIHAPGTGYTEIGVRHLAGGEFYDAKGEAKRIASEYSQTVLAAYAELGVVERWLQLSAAGELYRRSELANQGATAGLGDVELGAFTGLVQGDSPLRVSLGLSVGLPTGDADPTSGLADDFEADFVAASLPTGAGAYKLTPRLAVGIAFGGDAWPLVHYLSTSVGYVAWLGFSDSLSYSAELGSRPLNVPILRFVTLRLRATGLEPLEEAEGSSFSGVGEGVTYTSFGVGFAVDLPEGLGLYGAWETAPRAKRIIKATPYSAGLFWKF